MAKKALGKGIGALISQKQIPSKVTAPKGTYAGNTNNEIEIDKIGTNKNQPRKTFDEDELAGLADSIKSVGIIEPIVLRKVGQKFIIIAGVRRFRAAKIAGLKKVPAVVKTIGEDKVMIMALIENIQREDLNPIEEAAAYKELINELNIKQDDLAKRVGKSRVAVTNSMRLLNLPKSVQQNILEGKLSAGHARTLLRLKTKGQMEAMALKAIAMGYSVRELEKLTSTPEKEKKGNTNQAAENSPNITAVENRLQEAFGTKVNIVHKNGKGKIEIIYYDFDDLDRILEKVDA